LVRDAISLIATFKYQSSVTHPTEKKYASCVSPKTKSPMLIR
jgi:hypothetical protein